MFKALESRKPLGRLDENRQVSKRGDQQTQTFLRNKITQYFLKLHSKVSLLEKIAFNQLSQETDANQVELIFPENSLLEVEFKKKITVLTKNEDEGKRSKRYLNHNFNTCSQTTLSQREADKENVSQPPQVEKRLNFKKPSMSTKNLHSIQNHINRLKSSDKPKVGKGGYISNLKRDVSTPLDFGALNLPDSVKVDLPNSKSKL